MKVILNKDVPKLGYKADIVSVKEGYYRNYLQPRKLAEIATSGLVKMTETRKQKMVVKKQQLLDNAKDLIKKLKGLKIVLKGKVSEKGKLYGAITENEVIDAIEKATNIRFEKEHVKMAHIKETGDHTVLIHLGEGLEESVKVTVKAEKADGK